MEGGASPAKARRHDVDWLRVILFALLIWFHYAVFSLWQLEGGEGDFEVFNVVLYFVIGVMHQWRLAALFVISGMGTAFAFRRRSWQTYLGERGTRLGIPLLFGTYVLWFGIFDPIGKTKLLFTIFPGSEDMPYGHLWFIYNLLIYSILLTPLFAHIRENPDSRIVKAARGVLKMPGGIGIMLIPALVLSANAILFKPWGFGEVGMWWEFPRYLLYFLFGYLMITAKEEYFSVLDRVRIPVTILTPILAVVWFLCSQEGDVPNIMEGGWVDKGHPAFSSWAVVAALVQSFHSWFWCLFVFTWASKLLNRPSKWLSYLNEAVYPTYIIHMHLTFLPIMILYFIGIGYYLGMALGTVLVMAGVMVCFEVVRRARFARPLFGIKGGRDEVVRLWPYNQTSDESLRKVFSLAFHGLAFLVVLIMYVFMISAEWIGR
jgi:glucans biosynthesis protein C